MTVVVFAGGGTGGHLMPALAIADAMVEEDHRIEPYFVGSRRGVEAQVLPARPWRHTLLPLEPLYRQRWWRNARLAVQLVRSLRGIRRVLRRERPALVMGTGGYVSGPTVWAAQQAGIPTVLQEQNAYPGFATRRLARGARQVHLGFPEAERFLKAGERTRVFVTGNPIPQPPAPRPPRPSAKATLGFAPDRPLVLVVGGSQGALALNEAVAAALRGGLWPVGVQLLWQTGVRTHERFAALASDAVSVRAFLDPIADAYAAADLVVGRAGAMTLAELAAWGLPAILVPLPTAAANHQLVNARALAGAGAAVLLEQQRLSAESLAAQVNTVITQPARLADLARAIRDRGHPDAARRIARAALELVQTI
jgi:UDP-N-acetylglucosamine--N-acetylmuramyl-(pentapeptide) pyrophosphoryl-undecaprenol N-acetylglucosamine transferase